MYARVNHLITTLEVFLVYLYYRPFSNVCLFSVYFSFIGSSFFYLFSFRKFSLLRP